MVGNSVVSSHLSQEVSLVTPKESRSKHKQPHKCSTEVSAQKQPHDDIEGR